MQQIADWLKKLGMSEYAQRFAENGIDVSVLPHLTDQDLKDIGVLLGHRRKMLAAIAELSGSAPTTLEPVAATGPKTQDTAERRYLTVMFCDLIGSTGIAARLDAEEWRDLVGAYLDAAMAAVTEMGGHVAKKLGDGLMALFGYPVAQENDLERAVRAALAIQRALAELNRKNAGSGKPALAARIGLETGPVVVDAAGEIFGDAPNIAARVQGLAEPGAVVVTARVQRQVAGLFIAEERGSHQLKGVLEPVTLFRLVRASGGGRRSGSLQVTPLVGRDEEIASLTRRWERARQGDGQLVLIVGEPGLNPACLRSFMSGCATRRTPGANGAVRSYCKTHHFTRSPNGAGNGSAALTYPPTSASQSWRARWRRSSSTRRRTSPCLRRSWNIPLPQERVTTLAPEELRRRQLAALTAWMMAGARVQPVVLAFEDLHWADPTTLDLLRGIAERGALAPLFVVATTRPEFRPPWGTRSHHSTISLAPLDRAQVRDMVAELSARHALPRDVVEDVAARTGGVPLFVEEVTRLLLERGEQGGIQAIPPTLQQSLMARLDRLGPAREVAQVASVIGRGFSYGLLRALAGMEDAPLQAGLERLAEADILLVQGVPPESDYRFKHSLIQDAAYEHLLKSRRQVLHRRFAEVLRDNLSATASVEPELVAHHFSQAGLAEAAVEWWAKAGQRSLERSALGEAAVQLTRALEQIAALPATPALRREQIKLQVALITPLLHVKGFAAPEPKAAAERARLLIEQAEALGEPPEDPLLLFSVLYGFWVANIVAFNGDAVRELATQFLALAEKQRATVPLMIGHRLMGMSLLATGDIAESQAHLDRAIVLYDPGEHRPLATRFGQDLGVSTLSYRSFASWFLGYPEAALVTADRALKDAREIGQAATLMYTLNFMPLTYIYCGDYAAAKAQADEVVALAGEKGSLFWKAFGMMNQGWLFALTAKASDAVQMITSGITAWRSTGATLWAPLRMSHLKIRWCEAEIHRVAGEITLMSPEPDAAKAEAYFERALAVARKQQAKSRELRVAMSVARLWRDQGKRQQARNLLAPVYGWFTEGFDTLDLKEAKALLNELNA